MFFLDMKQKNNKLEKVYDFDDLVISFLSSLSKFKNIKKKKT